MLALYELLLYEDSDGLDHNMGPSSQYESGLGHDIGQPGVGSGFRY